MEGDMANPQGPSQEGTRGGADARGTFGRAPRDASEELVEASSAEAGELGRQARDTAEDIKRDIGELAGQAKEQAHSTATRQKEVAAQQMGGWAHALKAASDDLRNQGQNSVAAYVRQAADGLERASGNVRERDVDDLIGSVEDFARRQPVAFLGGAVAAGFGLARFMRSSADRRRSAGARADEGDAA
jgi:F0F1-type ATP synthase membrane subunit b/b'